MAFRVPTQVPRRQTPYSNVRPPALDIPASSEPVDSESAQWVVFSPSQTPSAAPTHTSSTQRTRTAGPLSDFGSFGTATRSAGLEGGADELDEPLDEDGTELDSLDDGLHAFRAPSMTQESSQSQRWDQGATMLPAHDGLGGFHASSQLVQDQLRQHERYSPGRRPDLRHRRRSSVQRHLDATAEQEVADDPERERWQRIENWRMEQSRAVLEEIEKHTRRRPGSRASRSSSDRVAPHPVPESLDTVPEAQNECPSQAASEADEPLWRRITRKLMRDVIGIDDSLLSVLFGESLPLADGDEPEDNCESSEASGSLDMDEAMQELDSGSHGHELWQTKLIHRIARELGILVHQFCEHPGAFSTYRNVTRSIPNEYAGIPLGTLPEEDTCEQSASANTTNSGTMMSPQFAPTLRDPNKEHAAQWGIEEDEYSNRPGDREADPLSESARLQQEKDYWERDLDIMLVFRYLWNRFGRRGGNTEHNCSSRGHIDPSRRAAIIRQHHPLVARAHSRDQAQNRRQSQHSGYSGPTGISSPLLRQHFRRPSSSCASQSAKMSAISSKRTLTGSSRNYWDIGGSVESGSAVAVGGTWGDV